MFVGKGWFMKRLKPSSENLGKSLGKANSGKVGKKAGFNSKEPLLELALNLHSNGREERNFIITTKVGEAIEALERKEQRDFFKEKLKSIIRSSKDYYEFQVKLYFFSELMKKAKEEAKEEAKEGKGTSLVFQLLDEIEKSSFEDVEGLTLLNEKIRAME